MPDVKTGTFVYPKPLGKIFPGASFNTTSAPLTQLIQPVKEDGSTHDNAFHSITIQAAPGNSGDVYVCNTEAAPDKTNYSNVLAVLDAREKFEWHRDHLNNACDISHLFIGADDADDFAIAYIDAY